MTEIHSIPSAMRVDVAVERLPHAEGLPLPSTATELAAGVDLLAAVPADEPMTISPREWAAVPTGLILALPAGTEAQVRPRSGLALKHGVTVLNAPGTIDADYRGEVKVILINLGPDDFAIRRGMRIAQLLVAPTMTVVWQPMAELGETVRGAGGFGSTGLEKE